MGKVENHACPGWDHTVVTTFLVMIVTGKVTEMMLKQREKTDGENADEEKEEEQDGSGDL